MMLRSRARRGKSVFCSKRITFSSGVPCLRMRKLGLEILGTDRATAGERARRLLQTYGLGGFERAYPRQLSGGMRQRVALIRTLATDPEIILLDEPFSALDYQTKLVMQREVHGIIRSNGKAALLVTHDIEEAVAMSDRVIVLSGRPRPGAKQL